MAQTAPLFDPVGAQQMAGRREEAVARNLELEVVVEVQPPPLAGVQGVATITTPPAVTAGTERGTPAGYESGPKVVFHATLGEPQPGSIAIMPGAYSELLLEETPTYSRPVTGE